MVTRQNEQGTCTGIRLAEGLLLPRASEGRKPTLTVSSLADVGPRPATCLGLGQGVYVRVLPWPAMLRMPVAASENIFDRLQDDIQPLHDAFQSFLAES